VWVVQVHIPALKEVVDQRHMTRGGGGGERSGADINEGPAKLNLLERMTSLKKKPKKNRGGNTFQ
jgi:hypothetical protein